ncbi:ankyrin repeat protein [Plakobranchus ocellatus]|uniref:Ankyrin repeat protein n=1 Tax=Plakobranchus ocellatus TaxID=259542 RepID=A0AAV3YHR1_9GAST|nr:ankyrin repeat protein [Plakobranchus ocellatus]
MIINRCPAEWTLVKTPRDKPGSCCREFEPASGTQYNGRRKTRIAMRRMYKKTQENYTTQKSILIGLLHHRMTEDAMFESLGAKGPKLVYSHSRQGAPPDGNLNENLKSATPNATNTSFVQSHVIPRPSVTVVAQTRKPDNQQESPTRNAGEPISNEDIMTVVTKTSSGEQQTQGKGNFPQTEIYHTFSRVSPQQQAANGRAYRAESEDKNSTKGVNIPIERVSSLDNNNNNNINNNGGSIEKCGSSVASISSESPKTPSESKYISSGYPEGYRVYRGKVYEIAREIPITVVPRSSPDSPVPARQSPSPSSVNNVLSSGRKPAHSSSATASITKVSPAQNKQSSNNYTMHSDSGHQSQQPRALPIPKLNGKTPNGISWSKVQNVSEPSNEINYNHLSPKQQTAFSREARHQLDDSRFSGSPDLTTYPVGAQNLRRPNTVSGRGNIRDLSPQNWVFRGRTGSASSTVPVTSATRRLSPQRSASMYQTLPLRETGGQIWTVATKSPPGSPRQKRSNNANQQVITRASYRLDPNISSKLQNSNPPPKSILKTSSSPSAAASSTSSNRLEYGNVSPLTSNPQHYTSDQTYTLPRPRATLVYRDFDFSALPQQQHTHANSHNRPLQQTNSIPSYHHKGKSQPTGSPSPNHVTSTTGRRPATAGAALQKNGEVGSKGLQPQKKSVTFNSQVRLHVDNNVSTIRSLSIDS